MHSRSSSVEVWLDFGFWLFLLGAGPDCPILFWGNNYHACFAVRGTN